MRQSSFSRTVESKRRDNHSSASRSIDAAALQSDLAARLKLPGSKINKLPIQNILRSKSVPSKQHTRVCPSCQASTTITLSEPACRECGFFFVSINQSQTLAQRRGLVKAQCSGAIVPQKEWDRIELTVADREDCLCPICMAGFSQGHEILLSCSHMFHRSCLEAFEKFMAKREERCCPLCRTHNYQKRVTHKGSRAFERVCAKKIQAVWRGYSTRLKLQVALKKIYKSKSSSMPLKKIFFERELYNCTKSLVSNISRRETDVGKVLLSSDATIAKSRQLNMLFDEMLKQRQALAVYHDPRYISTMPYEESGNTTVPKFPVIWDEVISSVVNRGIGDCAVCMTPIKCIPHRTVILLSCSHLYHYNCIEIFEKFNQNKFESTPSLLVCPVCRKQDYEKKVLDQRMLR